MSKKNKTLVLVLLLAVVLLAAVPFLTLKELRIKNLPTALFFTRAGRRPKVCCSPCNRGGISIQHPSFKTAL